MKTKKEKININLRYTGSDVDDGTMSIEDIVPVLQGLASAYGKIASSQGEEIQHKLRITGIQKGSFDILIEVWNYIQNNPDALLDTIKNIGGLIVIKQIIGVIKIKKHVENKPYTENINTGNQTIDIKNYKNVVLEIPIYIFNLYKNNLINTDLNKITAPLEKGKIDSTKISVKYDKESIEEKISCDEKEFFEIEEVITGKTDEIWLIGIFNSLTKSTNKGFFILNDGSRISYRLSSENPEDLYKYFIVKNPVKVRCIAHLDENLKPARIDIFEVKVLQQELFEKNE